MNIKKWYENKEKFLFWITIIGLALRIIFFISNLFICGVHIDESMLFANALSIAKNGTDLLGNKMPVYFPTWLIGGQSPLGTYLSAITVKFFGNSLFVLRLPALLIGCIGLICSVKLGDLLFSKKDFKYAFASLAAISPWMIFSSCYVLDCNYMGYNLIFGILLFLKGQKQDKNICYIFSMLFFSFCFYSYIASVLIIPVFLAILYLILFINKKIKLSNCVLSVIFLFIFSIPFIIFGLVLIGKIKPFTTHIISFPDMKFYSRNTSIALSSDRVFDIIKILFENFFEAMTIILFPDSTVLSSGANLFLYGNICAGLISIFGLIDILLTKIHHKDNIFNDIAVKSIVIASGGAIAIFCALTNNPLIIYAYRYGVLTPLLLSFEAIGLVQLIKRLQSVSMIKFKKILVGYLIVSFLFFGTEFFYIYQNDTKSGDFTYGDSLKICLNESDKITPNDTTIICNTQCDQSTIVYLYYFRQDKNLNNFLDCMFNSYTKSSQMKTGYSINKSLQEEINNYVSLHPLKNNIINVSDTITILNSNETELTKKCYIIQHSKLNQFNHENYTIIENGFYDTLIRK